MPSRFTRSSAPLIAGSYVRCAVESEQRSAEIVKRRLIDNGEKSSVNGSDDEGAILDPSQFEYYVHFKGCDRRLDEWVTFDRIKGEITDPEEIASFERAEGKKATSKRQKRAAAAAAALEEDDEATVSIWGHGQGHDEHTKVRNIQRVQFGKYVIPAWYYSPYPGDYGTCDTLYICEFTFKYMRKRSTYERHLKAQRQRHPPGKEIYRDESKRLSVYEIDGRVDVLYCQNLCLFAKLFIEHKTLYYDPEPFMFYVVVEWDDEGACHPMGYFSKERASSEGYNLACILVLPVHQRKGLGKFLISLSYEISKRAGVEGHPEKPLSDLGKVAYRSYWSCIILYIFRNMIETQNFYGIEQMVHETSIRKEDLISTLHVMDMLKHMRGQYAMCVNKHNVMNRIEVYVKKRYAGNFVQPMLFLQRADSDKEFHVIGMGNKEAKNEEASNKMEEGS